MSLSAVFLDAGPLSEIVRRPGQNPQADACRAWVLSLVSAGVLVCVADVTDYEVRRELLRAGKTSSVRRLDALENSIVEYVPLTTNTLRESATLWALARNTGQSTAPPEALDADVILCSAVKLFTMVQGISLSSAIVATTNVAHIARFVSADLWSNIANLSESENDHGREH